MSKVKNCRFAVLLFLSIGLPLWGAIQPETYYGQIAQVVVDGLPRAHVTHQDFGDSIAEKALANFLRALDFDRTFFLKEDVEQFKAEAAGLDDQLRKGHIETAYRIFDLFIQRASNRVDFARQLLDQGLDVQTHETIQLDRQESPWAAHMDEWNDLWRKKVLNEYLAQVVSRTLAKEAPPEAESLPVPTETNSAERAEVKPEPAPEKSPTEWVRDRYGQFLTVLRANDAEYVLQLYLNSFTQAYDTHSEYLSTRANEDFDISMKLSLTGIGALLSYEDGAAKVVRLIAGGPAERDGRLKPNDKIIAVAQGDAEPVDIMYWPLYKSVRLIRGEKGTPVVLSVIPALDAAGGTVKKIDLIRDEIKLEERMAKSEVHEPAPAPGSAPFKLGVITLPDFYADQQGIKQGDAKATSSSRDVNRILSELKEQHVDGVLLDLRNNGGGSLPDAVEMTGYFIDRGPVVQVKANRRLQSLDDPHPGVVYDGPLVILVNRQSASASEILAGALQDYGRAVVVGDSKTHGKGTVQTLFPVQPDRPEFGALKITTAGFYRIDGRTTQFKGVVPDIVIPSALDVMEIGEEFLPNPMTLSEIAPTGFKKNTGLENLREPLKIQSEARRRNDPKYIRYEEVVRRLGEKMNRKEISLNLEDRLTMARSDKELEDLMQQVIGESEEPSADKPKNKDGDVILNEALNVLHDLVAAEAATAPAEVAEPAANRDIPQS